MEALLLDLAKQSGSHAIALTIVFFFFQRRMSGEIKRLTKNIADLTKEIRNLSHSNVKLEVQVEALNKMKGKVDRTAEGVSILFDRTKSLKEPNGQNS